MRPQTKHIVWMLAIIALLAGNTSITHAQVAPMPWVKIQWFDNNGNPCAGCLLYTYQAGTSTPLVTYSDPAGTMPNANPVVADAAGRMNVFVGTSAYKFILTLPNMVQLFSDDNVTSSSVALLSTNNTWTGSNTFNGVVTFNATPVFTTGFTAAGPVNLTLGGSLAGTFSGSPTFSGTPNFAGGIVLASLSLSGQLTSTVSTGTAPFVIASTTEVPNLNVNFLQGDDWASPGTIGSTTPNSGVFTTLKANTSFVLNGSSTLTAVQGTDTSLMSSGTISGGTGTSVCLDSNAGLTTSGCAAGHLISLGTNSSVCSTAASAGAECSTSVTISPNQPDTLYIANCNGITPTQYPFIIGLSKATNSITVTISNGTASQAQISTFAELDCSAIHP